MLKELSLRALALTMRQFVDQVAGLSRDCLELQHSQSSLLNSLPTSSVVWQARDYATSLATGLEALASGLANRMRQPRPPHGMGSQA